MSGRLHREEMYFYTLVLPSFSFVLFVVNFVSLFMSGRFTGGGGSIILSFSPLWTGWVCLLLVLLVFIHVGENTQVGVISVILVLPSLNQNLCFYKLRFITFCGFAFWDLLFYEYGNLCILMIINLLNGLSTVVYIIGWRDPYIVYI